MLVQSERILNVSIRYNVADSAVTYMYTVDDYTPKPPRNI